MALWVFHKDVLFGVLSFMGLAEEVFFSQEGVGAFFRVFFFREGLIFLSRVDEADEVPLAVEGVDHAVLDERNVFSPLFSRAANGLLERFSSLFRGDKFQDGDAPLRDLLPFNRRRGGESEGES